MELLEIPNLTEIRYAVSETSISFDMTPLTFPNGKRDNKLQSRPRAVVINAWYTEP
jgi:hypothetical protein